MVVSICFDIEDQDSKYVSITFRSCSIWKYTAPEERM